MAEWGDSQHGKRWKELVNSGAVAAANARARSPSVSPGVAEEAVCDFTLVTPLRILLECQMPPLCFRTRWTLHGQQIWWRSPP